MKHTFLFILISLVLLGCKKEEIDNPIINDQNNAHIDGYITNRATGDPIQGFKLKILHDPGWWGTLPIEIVSERTTNSMGYFLFDENYQDYDNIDTWLSLGNFKNDYQNMVLVNGVFQDFGTFGRLRPDFNSTDPQTYNIEFYPIASFEIVLNNIPPASSDDRINITLKNMEYGTQTYEFIGAIQNEVISSETKFENELIINYAVTSNEMVSSYQITLECTPGEETIFELNY